MKYTDMQMNLYIKVKHLDERNVLKSLTLDQVKPYLSIKTIVNSDENNKYAVKDCQDIDPTICLDDSNPKLALTGKGSQI